MAPKPTEGTPPDPETPPTDPSTPPAEGETPPEDVSGLKSALNRERDNVKAATQRAVAAEQDAEKLRKEGADAVAQAKADGKAEAAREVRDELVPRLQDSTITAAAADKFKNPKYAPKLIDRSLLKIDDDGNIDDASLTAALDKLLTDDPSLARGPAAPPLPGSGGRQGQPIGSGITVDDRIRALARPQR